MAGRTKYEQRSTLDALEAFLTARGYTGITYRDGYQPETQIEPPYVTVTIPPHSPKTLQMGKVAGQESLYQRSITINAYMENERRAGDIVDDIFDFMELECVIIKDHMNNELGYLRCNDDDGILGQVFPPIMSVPQKLRWRGAVTGPFEAFYPNA